jgi:hypothetical protein
MCDRNLAFVIYVPGLEMVLNLHMRERERERERERRGHTQDPA